MKLNGQNTNDEFEDILLFPMVESHKKTKHWQHYTSSHILVFFISHVWVGGPGEGV